MQANYLSYKSFLVNIKLVSLSLIPLSLFPFSLWCPVLVISPASHTRKAICFQPYSNSTVRRRRQWVYSRDGETLEHANSTLIALMSFCIIMSCSKLKCPSESDNQISSFNEYPASLFSYHEVF